MGSFDASLKTLGDRTGLPATVELEDGRLSISAGNDSIGDWSLDEISLEAIPNGYRMAAEGDQIFMELTDVERFASELSQKPRRRRKSGARRAAAKSEQKAKKKTPKVEKRREARKRKAGTKETTEAASDVAAETNPEPRQRTRIEEPIASVRSTEAPREEPDKPPTKGASFLQRIDRVLAAAESKWGSLLPEWVFTRIMFGVVVGSLILMIALPGLVSTFLLITGFLIVVFGAAIYTDPMLGAKWLPGRMSPAHVLLLGVAILMFGVLLGVIAR